MELLQIGRYLLYCSIVIPLAPLCFYPVSSYIKRPLPILLRKIFLALAGAAWLVAFFGYFVFPLPGNTNFVLMFIGVYSFYLYHKEIKIAFAKKVFVFLTACLVGGFSLLFATIADYTLHPTGNSGDFSLEALLVQVLFLLAADVLLYLPFSRYMGWAIANFHEEAIWKRVCIFPALFFLATFFLFPRRYSLMYVGRLRELYPFVLLFFTFFVLLVYFLFYVIAYTYVQKQKTEIENQILSIQGAQYQQLLRTVEENSRIRHDFRQQLIVIAELAGQKKYEKLEEYVRRYMEDARAEVKLYSYSAAVNALISYYEAICLRRKIRTDFSVFLPEQLPIKDQDFCVLLGNLLENAIDGVREIEQRYIFLKIRQTASNMLAVRMTNPWRGKFQREGDYYRSSKREGFGQGLQSVRVIVEKYQGMLEVLPETDVFTVKILLQIASGEEGEK